MIWVWILGDWAVSEWVTYIVLVVAVAVAVAVAAVVVVVVVVVEAAVVVFEEEDEEEEVGEEGEGACAVVEAPLEGTDRCWVTFVSYNRLKEDNRNPPACPRTVPWFNAFPTARVCARSALQGTLGVRCPGLGLGLGVQG